MKKIFFALLATLLLASANDAQATHLMGGDLIVRYDSNMGGYQVYLTHYRDAFGIPAAQSITCDVYKFDSISNIYWYTGQLITLQPDFNNWAQPLTGVPYPVERYNYMSPPGQLGAMLSFYGNSKYKFVVYECCRNAAIQNIASPTSFGFTLTCEFDFDTTKLSRTPQCLSLPVIYGPVNNVWNYNPFPYDADGDSISWQINTPICSGGVYTSGSGNFDTCFGYTTPPSNATTPFALNSLTGELTWSPSLTGNFIASFKIIEYDSNGIIKGNTIRDMQYIVLPDSGSAGSNGNKMPNFSTVTNYQTSSSTGAHIMYYTPGTSLTFEIDGTDSNATDSLKMEGISDLFLNNTSNASFSTTYASSSNAVRGKLTWTPSSTEKRDRMVVFRIKDGSYMRDFTLMLSKQTTSTGLNSFAKKSIQKIYPNPCNGIVQLTSYSAGYWNGATITLSTIAGSVANTTSISNHAGANYTYVPNVQPGIYLMQVSKPGYKPYIGKLIVQ